MNVLPGLDPATLWDAFVTNVLAEVANRDSVLDGLIITAVLAFAMLVTTALVMPSDNVPDDDRPILTEQERSDTKVDTKV